MGRFDFEVSQEFLKTLGRLADVDKVAPKMIEEALPICTRTLKAEFEARNHEYSTGELANSIREGKVTRQKNGAWKGVARPTGKDSKGIRNMAKLAYYEYGTYKGEKQPPRPIMDKVRNDCSLPCQESMEQTFKREMGLK